MESFKTGLYYYGARYYDPRTSVWQSPDPILAEFLPTGDPKKDKQLPAGGVFTPGNLNLFAYTRQNPVRYVDPSGMVPKTLTVWQGIKYAWFTASRTGDNVNARQNCASTALQISKDAYKYSTGKKVSIHGETKGKIKAFKAKQLFPGSKFKNINYYKEGGGQSYNPSSTEIDDQFNSKNVEVGSVGIFKKPDSVEGNWTGHVITVTGVKRDKDGNVQEIRYISGHQTPGDKATPSIFRKTDVDSSGKPVYSNGVEFIGWGEVEPKGQNPNKK